MDFILVLLPPMLWASAVLTDKILVNGDGEDSKPGALVAISGFFNLAFGLLVLGPIMLLDGQGFGIDTFVPLLANGVTYVAAMWLFLHALRVEEASKVDPWFQVITAFGIIFAFAFIGEKLEWFHILAIALLAIGGWVIKSSGKANWKAVGFMLAASVLLAVNDVVFAKFGRELDTVPAIFSDVVGKAFWGLAFLIGGKARRGFVLGLRTKFKLQSLSDVLAISADFLFDRAKLFAPVAIVQGIACSQPVFTLLGAALLTKLVPKLLSEVQGTAFWKKLGGIALAVIGGAILAITS